MAEGNEGGNSRCSIELASVWDSMSTSVHCWETWSEDISRDNWAGKRLEQWGQPRAMNMKDTLLEHDTSKLLHEEQVDAH